MIYIGADHRGYNLKEALKEYMDELGIVICGSGVGVDEVANKVPGIRSGLAMNKDQIKAARHDDDINVLALAADFTSEEDAKAILKTFLCTDFGSEEKYKRRIEQIEEIEDEF